MKRPVFDPTLLRMAALARPYAGLLALAYLCMVILNLTTVAYAALLGPALQFVFTGDITTMLRGPGGELRPLWSLLPTGALLHLELTVRQLGSWLLPALIVGLAVLKGIAQTGQFFLFGRASQHVLKHLRNRAFSALLSHPPAFFQARAHGDLLSRLGQDSLEVERAYFYGFGSLLRDTLAVAGLLGYLFYADWQLALITGITVPAAVLPLARFSRWMKRVSRRGQQAQGEMLAIAHEALAGAEVVQAFNREQHELQRLEHAATKYYRHMLRSYLIRASRTPVMEALGAVALAGLLVLLARHVHFGGGDPAHYVSFLGAIFLMYDPLKKLGKVSDYLAAGSAAAERMFELIDLPPAVTDAPHAVPLHPFSTAPEAMITFRDVSFGYRPNELVLQNVTLSIPRGHSVAVVGPSGAGKSTLARLLPRFYDLEPHGGTITIGGQDIRHVTLASLRSQIALVTQDTFLFNCSARDNIAYGLPGASEQQIQEAARAAQAHDFILSLPQGYHTPLGERGVRLSGGQRQRIAIARALLRNAPILILDEASSHLDMESERALRGALERLMEGRTSLVIAHRLTTVQRANSIVVLRNGRIVEQGSHHDLLQQGGEYARLYAMQFEQTGAPEQHEAC